MLDIIIQNSSIDIYQRILDTGTALIGYVTGVIAIYVAWLKYFSKNIKLIELGENLTDFYGDSIYCIIENATLSTFSIMKINIVDEKNKKEALLANYKPPLLLKPFETLKIEEKYTTKNGDLDVFSDKTFILIQTTRSNIKAKLKRKSSRKCQENLTLSKRMFNNEVISKDVRYVLQVVETDGTPKTVYINDVGDLSMQISYFNSIRGNDISSKEKVEEFFKPLFEPVGIKYKVTDLWSNKK